MEAPCSSVVAVRWTSLEAWELMLLGVAFGCGAVLASCLQVAMWIWAAPTVGQGAQVGEWSCRQERHHSEILGLWLSRQEGPIMAVAGAWAFKLGLVRAALAVPLA